MLDVGIGINQIQRVTPIITWYLLGYIAAMPLLGRASDRFGRKLLLQASLAGFAVGSVITAMSTDLDILVVGRLIQGIASGALLPVTLALAADLWSSRNRAAVLGGVGAAQEFGSVIGPMYGIAMVALFNHWQAVFWVNVPLALLAMVMIQFSLPSQPKPENPEKVDVVGGLLLALTLGLATFGPVQPRSRRQTGASAQRPRVAHRRAGVGCGVLRVGAIRPHAVDRTRRRAFPAVPRGAGRLVGHRRGTDGDPGQRRAVRTGCARPGPGPGRLPATAIPDRSADRGAIRRLDRHQGRRSDRGVRRAADRRGRLLPGLGLARRRAVGHSTTSVSSPCRC